MSRFIFYPFLCWLLYSGFAVKKRGSAWNCSVSFSNGGFSVKKKIPRKINLLYHVFLRKKIGKVQQQFDSFCEVSQNEA